MPAPPPPSRLYDFVERRHLRQWALRFVPPAAALATNGSGWIDVAWLPRHDAPLRALGLPAAAGVGCVAAGAAAVAVAAVLRVLAKAVLVRKTVVTTAGIYGRVRHPFYLATLVGGVGTFALAGPLGVVAAAAWLVLALPVFLVTIAGEETGLRAAHGAAWDAYAAAVPRLLPRGRHAPAGAGEPARGTWANLVHEGEPPRGLRFLAGAALVVACRLGGTAGTVAACAAAAAFAGSHVVARRSRRER